MLIVDAPPSFLVRGAEDRRRSWENEHPAALHRSGSTAAAPAEAQANGPQALSLGPSIDSSPLPASGERSILWSHDRSARYGRHAASIRYPHRGFRIVPHPFAGPSIPVELRAPVRSSSPGSPPSEAPPNRVD